MQKRIGLIGENSITFVEYLLKIWNDGNVAVLIDWRIPIEKISEMLTEAGAIQCYIEKRFYQKNSGTKFPIQFITFDNNQKEPKKLPDALYKAFQNNYSTDEAIVLFSSGTTGRSKGIILSHYAIQTNADYIYNYMKLDHSDRMIIIKTLIHSSTLVGELLVCLKYGIITYICPSTLLPNILLEWIGKLNVTTMCVNPSLLLLLSRAVGYRNFNLDHLKRIYTSGSIVPVTVLELAKKSFPQARILNVYGLTEAGPRIAAQTEDTPMKIGSVGRAIGDVIINVRNSNGENVMPREIGMVYVKTPCQFTAYILGNTIVELDGWLNTGDTGYFDEDGDLFITGRKDTMLSIGSHNLYPEQIEDVIITHSEVVDCVVTSQKNILNGNILICKYIAKQEMTHELRKICMAHLASYEIPAVFERVEVIPKTATGKKIRAKNGIC